MVRESKMEYGGLVQNGAYGSLSDYFAPAETDLIDELFIEGCWVETRVGSKSNTMSNINMEVFQEESDAEREWWIGPRRNPAGPCSSVKERLVVAVGYLKEYVKNSNVLIQVWVPARRGVLSLTTRAQDNYPYTLGLEQDDSRAFQFVEEDWVHDWIPNVRFFTSHKYPRVHQYHLRPGSLALPVFERGTAICLGVVEILLPNNNPDLHNLSHALQDQAVDFRTSSHHNFIPPAVIVKVLSSMKINNYIYLLIADSN